VSKLNGISIQAGIDTLQDDEEGFFIMCEGGKIDGACHAGDQATAIHEVIAFDKAVETVLKFYEAHPEETLILVGADHETGGLSLGYDRYLLNFEPITKIKTSYSQNVPDDLYDIDAICKMVEEIWPVELTEEDIALMTLRLDSLNNTLKDDLKKELPDYSDEQIEEIIVNEQQMYNRLGWVISSLLSRQTQITFGSFMHTAEPVPWTAIGVRSDDFQGVKDNTDVNHILSDIMGVESSSK
jgi:alkaline phosphatase